MPSWLRPRRPRPAAGRSPGSPGSVQGAAPAGGGAAQRAAPASSAPLPPLAAGAAGAVQAAEREIGVPYVWGGESPAGFDCSGLVAWAYAQVGISLPHYSGAQYDDTTHIPLADIEPGDLLFYGPGGSEHVAMYVGGGSMIEAPYTGASVWITGVRTGGGLRRRRQGRPESSIRRSAGLRASRRSALIVRGQLGRAASDPTVPPARGPGRPGEPEGSGLPTGLDDHGVAGLLSRQPLDHRL